MASIGNLDLGSVMEYVWSYSKRPLKPLIDYLEIPLSEIQPLRRLKSRIDEMYVFFEGGDSDIIKNTSEFRKDSQGRIFDADGPVIKIKALLLFIDRCNFPTACILMARLHCIMESIEAEIQDMIDEFSAWKIFLCSMALHPRLGERSIMRSLGCDLMKLVFKNFEN